MGHKNEHMYWMKGNKAYTVKKGLPQKKRTCGSPILFLGIKFATRTTAAGIARYRVGARVGWATGHERVLCSRFCHDFGRFVSHDDFLSAGTPHCWLSGS